MRIRKYRCGLWGEILSETLGSSSVNYRSHKLQLRTYFCTYFLQVEVLVPTILILILESVHYNFVRKIRPHNGGQVLYPTNLRKSSERVTHNNRLHYVYKSLVVRDPLRGFSQFCRMKNLSSNMWSYFLQ